MTDRAHTGGTRARPGRRAPADVRIDDGVVVVVGVGAQPDDDECRARCRRLRRAPGFVDLHAHLREPGKEEAETIETGARRGARRVHGVVAMPNTDPTQDYVSVVEFVRRQGQLAGLCEVPRRVGSRSVASATSWHRSPSSPQPGCGSSPTTATACRTRC